MKRTLQLIISVLAIAVSMPAGAQIIQRKKLVELNMDSVERVIVAGDTVPVIMPEKNYGRFDRGLYNYMFIPKGKFGFGITANYGELQTEDVAVLSILKDFDFKGKMYSIKPYISYFYKSNMSVGLKFNYTRGIADLGHMAVDFDDDLNFTLRDVSYNQKSFSVAAFHRAYVGLDAGGRFGIFNETDLAFGSGSSRFKRLYNGEPKDTHTTTTKGSLNFSPGVCVFLQDYLSFNVSFGVFGLQWKKEDQTTDGVDEGSRVTSGANFRFNVFNINFGLMVVI